MAAPWSLQQDDGGLARGGARAAVGLEHAPFFKAALLVLLAATLGVVIIWSQGGLSPTFRPRVRPEATLAARGQQVTLSVIGFTPGEALRIRWRTPDQRWVDVGRAVANQQGNGTTFVTVPRWAADGINEIRAEGRTGRAQSDVLSVEGGFALEVAPSPRP